MPKHVHLPEERVLADYLSGQFTHRELAARYGVSKMPIQDLLRRHGIVSLRPAHPRPQYAHDTTFFDVIDTEAKAYWLGFLAADGCVIDRGRKGMSVSLSLAEKDGEHVERFRRAIGATNPLDTYRQSGFARQSTFVRIAIHGSDLPRGLMAHGVHPRKTFTHDWPGLEGEMLRHYLRGYVDGDGHIGQARFTVAGTMAFLTQFQRYIRSIGAGGGTIAFRHGPESIAILSCGGARQVEMIHAHLYRDATIALPRKANVRQVRPVKRWAEIADACLSCGTTERPHNAHGLCKRCYDRRNKSPSTFRPSLTGRWASAHDCCVICGTTERPHQSKGACDRCYGRMRYLARRHS